MIDYLIFKFLKNPTQEFFVFVLAFIFQSDYSLQLVNFLKSYIKIIFFKIVLIQKSLTVLISHYAIFYAQVVERFLEKEQNKRRKQAMRNFLSKYRVISNTFHILTLQATYFQPQTRFLLLIILIYFRTRYLIFTERYMIKQSQILELFNAFLR
ncbi:transmembrane protein, putative (macronuclear) [Tetrahymena thermophila SB210]|uniref:Transmembrane protein, putative n=1 Tax=Tetrahymena thermophila (strain SB210) TaxID=312017 RepID=W7XEI1_TETTS|nr:transmembrane protein, putative [Tetrahymena thermophila SB210]EWS75083.1 transmembrane protein, putative [Tetrahymena thermophila SB210]|eukprot:XP_012652396.1 transmembrane protein, putative [Tetrahymena thermophila SB210]